MKCPCGGELRVNDTVTNGLRTYRRRKCKECGRIIFTTERIDKSIEPRRMLSMKSSSRNRPDKNTSISANGDEE